MGSEEHGGRGEGRRGEGEGEEQQREGNYFISLFPPFRFEKLIGWLVVGWVECWKAFASLHVASRESH